MPYELRDQAWKDYAEKMDMPDMVGFDYTRKAVEEAFKAGWAARKDAQYSLIKDAAALKLLKEDKDVVG